jgi:oligoribonuclease
MNDFVKNMHQSNGLLDRLDEAPSAEEVESDWIDMLQRVNKGDPKRVVFVGNSLSAVDLPFIRACMPEVLDEVHYRTMDITGLRMLFGVWTGEDCVSPKKKTHRAEDDILECQEEFRFLMKSLCKAADGLH